MSKKQTDPRFETNPIDLTKRPAWALPCFIIILILGSLVWGIIAKQYENPRWGGWTEDDASEVVFNVISHLEEARK